MSAISANTATDSDRTATVTWPLKRYLNYLNSGYEWVIDLDIEKYFDSVNHDKLISILRERINDAPTLHLIRSFLKAGVMEDGLVSPTEWGVPQGTLCRYRHKPPYAEIVVMPS